jgi:hypothetical protein
MEQIGDKGKPLKLGVEPGSEKMILVRVLYGTRGVDSRWAGLMDERTVTRSGDRTYAYPVTVAVQAGPSPAPPACSGNCTVNALPCPSPAL